MTEYMVMIGSIRVLRVRGKTEAQARKMAIQQLDRPSRQNIYTVWLDSGEELAKITREEKRDDES